MLFEEYELPGEYEAYDKMEGLENLSMLTPYKRVDVRSTIHTVVEVPGPPLRTFWK